MSCEGPIYFSSKLVPFGQTTQKSMVRFGDWTWRKTCARSAAIYKVGAHFCALQNIKWVCRSLAMEIIWQRFQKRKTWSRCSSVCRASLSPMLLFYLMLYDTIKYNDIASAWDWKIIIAYNHNFYLFGGGWSYNKMLVHGWSSPSSNDNKNTRWIITQHLQLVPGSSLYK